MPIDIGQYRRTRLAYRWDGAARAFVHNYSTDWQLVVVWPKARDHLSDIIDDLRGEFSVRFVAEHYWTAERLVENATRFYQNIPSNTPSIPSKIGDGHFYSIVVQDPEPRYRFDRTVSGSVLCVNEKVTHHKGRYRDLAGGFNVHSSNSLAEFFEQATLLYGPAALRRILSSTGTHDGHEILEGDLYGAGGWSSLSDLFEVLNLTSEYVVLRNFDMLPDWQVGSGGDVDVLCGSLNAFVAASNARVPDRTRPHRCYVNVEGAEIPFDVRYLGDGYIDSVWARDMLGRHDIHRQLVNVPRVDDHFFSLLYHAKLQKRQISDGYVELLPRLAAQIGLDWFTAGHAVSDEEAAEVLNGYLGASGYRYTIPIDRKVVRNDRVLQLLSFGLNPNPPLMSRVRRAVGRTLSSKAPRWLRRLTPKSLRLRIGRRLLK